MRHTLQRGEMRMRQIIRNAKGSLTELICFCTVWASKDEFVARVETKGLLQRSSETSLFHVVLRRCKKKSFHCKYSNIFSNRFLFGWYPPGKLMKGCLLWLIKKMSYVLCLKMFQPIATFVLPLKQPADFLESRPCPSCAQRLISWKYLKKFKPLPPNTARLEADMTWSA